MKNNEESQQTQANARTGILLVAHHDLGPALLEAAADIVGRIPGALALPIWHAEDLEHARHRVFEALGGLLASSEEGVLILTDIPGATPHNVCASLSVLGRIKIVSGVNLPVLLKAITVRNEMGLPELAEFLAGYGAGTFVVC